MVGSITFSSCSLLVLILSFSHSVRTLLHCSTTLGSGPNSRTSQLFISYGKSTGLGKEPWETPIGKVVEGMENAHKFYSYGDMPPWGKGPVQGKIHSGRKYIDENFPLTDKFKTCTVEIVGSNPDAVNEGKGAVEDQREIMQDVGEDWEVHAKESENRGRVGKFLKSKLNEAQTKLNESSIGGTDELGMLVIGFVVVMGVFLICTLRKKPKSSKAS